MKKNLITPIEIIEKYKTIDCFGIRKNYYEVSNMGDIREIESGKKINQRIDNGYKVVYLKREGYSRGKSYLAHRIVTDTFCNHLGLNGDDYFVNHKDLDRSNNIFYNLEYCTQKENVHHAIRKGVFKMGEDRSNAKFNNTQIHAICKGMEDGIPYPEILNSINVESNKRNLDILAKIRSGKLWRHISYRYNIPEKDFRSPQIIYTDDQIHFICELLEKGYKLMEIGRALNIPLNTIRDRDKYFKFVNRIKQKQTYTHISKDYKF